MISYFLSSLPNAGFLYLWMKPPLEKWIYPSRPEPSACRLITIPCLQKHRQLLDLYLRKLNVRFFVLAVVVKIGLDLRRLVKYEISGMVRTVGISTSAVMVIPDKGALEYAVTEPTSFANKLWVI